MATVSVYVVSFNCGLQFIDVNAVASQLFNGIDEGNKLPDVIALSLQEVAPLSHAFIGGSFLAPHLVKLQDALDLAVKGFGVDGDEFESYSSTIARHVGMTAIMVFAKDPSAVKALETAGVGVGASSMGNKGAVGVRFTYHGTDGNGRDSTELTFVAAHLAAMEEHLQRRNEDWKHIVQRLVFTPATCAPVSRRLPVSAESIEEEAPLMAGAGHAAGIYKPTSHLFVAGDLNYRTSVLKPAADDYRKTFPQPYHTEADPQHYSKLFEHDQLTQERRAGRTCHGLSESSVTFPPTYKYDVDEPILIDDDGTPHWNWAKHRWPSWCDRILYLPIPSWLKARSPNAEIVPHKYIALPPFGTSDHRAVAQLFTVPLISIPEPGEDDDSDDPRVHPPYEIDPNWKKLRASSRRFEIWTGVTAYLTTTWEGIALVLATGAAVVGGYFLVKAAIDF